jgi:hypothetical protein
MVPNTIICDYNKKRPSQGLIFRPQRLRRGLTLRLRTEYMMARDALKLAAYLDEAGEEPESGCHTLVSKGIHYVVLRHCWTGNICGISDTGHQKLANLLNGHNLTTICIASELGQVDANQLSRISDDQIDKVLHICAYYGAPMVRIFIGNKTNGEASKSINEWMQRISDKCLIAGITPLLEITKDSHLFKAPDIAKLLSDHVHWRLLYDPVQLIIQQNQNPFVRYWTLLKDKTGVIDIRDFKIGKGFKPAGFGDSKIDLTITDALNSNYKGWFFLEPSLGRRHGQAQTKKETFQFALEGLDAVLQ